MTLKQLNLVLLLTLDKYFTRLWKMENRNPWFVAHHSLAGIILLPDLAVEWLHTLIPSVVAASPRHLTLSLHPMPYGLFNKLKLMCGGGGADLPPPLVIRLSDDIFNIFLTGVLSWMKMVRILKDSPEKLLKNHQFWQKS